MSWESLYTSGIWRPNSTKFPNEVGETVGTSKKKPQLVRLLRSEINQEDLNILQKKSIHLGEKNHKKEREIFVYSLKIFDGIGGIRRQIIAQQICITD